MKKFIRLSQSDKRDMTCKWLEKNGKIISNEVSFPLENVIWWCPGRRWWPTIDQPPAVSLIRVAANRQKKRERKIVGAIRVTNHGLSSIEVLQPRRSEKMSAIRMTNKEKNDFPIFFLHILSAIFIVTWSPVVAERRNRVLFVLAYFFLFAKSSS